MRRVFIKIQENIPGSSDSPKETIGVVEEEFKVDPGKKFEYQDANNRLKSLGVVKTTARKRRCKAPFEAVYTLGLETREGKDFTITFFYEER